MMGLLVSPDGVVIDPDTRLPQALAILGASPNPMRDDLAIRLRSGSAQRLDVEVFDLLGPDDPLTLEYQRRLSHLLCL